MVEVVEEGGGEGGLVVVVAGERAAVGLFSLAGDSPVVAVLVEATREAGRDASTDPNRGLAFLDGRFDSVCLDRESESHEPH